MLSSTYTKFENDTSFYKLENITHIHLNDLTKRITFTDRKYLLFSTHTHFSKADIKL
jgi:hypothetical protein